MESPRPVPWIASLEPAVHGAFNPSTALGLDIAERQILDFSANGNVIGLPAGVAAAIADVDLARYPDRRATELRQAIAASHDLSPANIVVGNGATELIWAVARAYLAPGDHALVIGPTYGEYEVATRATGAVVSFATLPGRRPNPGATRAAGAVISAAGLPEHGPNPGATHADRAQVSAVTLSGRSPDPGGLGAAAPMSKGRVGGPSSLTWICHPNNPTGDPFPIESLPDLIRASPSTLFVVDEAYLSLSEGTESALPCIGGGHVVVLRSLTKDLGLAGLRVGYALASAEVAAALGRALPPWNVSSVAQAGAIAALADVDHLERARAAVTKSRAHLLEGLQRINLHPYPTVTNFVLVPVGSGAAVARALLDRGFAVRDCASFGLPECIRIGVRPLADQERLLAALAKICPRVRL